MSRKNDFNEGIESGIRLAEPIVKQNTAAMEYLMEKVGDMHNGQSLIRSSVEDLLNEMNADKAMKLYGILVTKAPKEILKEEHLKILFNYINVANQVNEANSSQKQFLNNIRRYFNYLSVFGFDPDFNIYSMDNIGETEVSKEIFRILKMYDFLSDLSFETSIFDDDIWDSFQLNRFAKKDICNSIEIIYSVFAEDGIIESYGEYDVEEINEQTSIIDSLLQDESEYTDISENCICTLQNNFLDWTFLRNHTFSASGEKVLEGSNYVSFVDDGNIISIHKESGNTIKYPNVDKELKRICVYGDYIIYLREKKAYANKIGNDVEDELLLFSFDDEYTRLYAIVKGYIIFYSSDTIKSYNIKSKETVDIPNFKGYIFAHRNEVYSIVYGKEEKDTQFAIKKYNTTENKVIIIEKDVIKNTKNNSIYCDNAFIDDNNNIFVDFHYGSTVSSGNVFDAIFFKKESNGQLQRVDDLSIRRTRAQLCGKYLVFSDNKGNLIKYDIKKNTKDNIAKIVDQHAGAIIPGGLLLSAISLEKHVGDHYYYSYSVSDWVMYYCENGKKHSKLGSGKEDKS